MKERMNRYMLEIYMNVYKKPTLDHREEEKNRAEWEIKTIRTT